MRQFAPAIARWARPEFAGQALGRCWWRALRRLGPPPPPVLDDAPHDTRIVDQGDDPHRPLTLGALQGVGFIDFADQPWMRGRMLLNP